MPLWSDVSALINSGGVVFLMAAALIGGAKGWWVYGSTHREVVKDRDFWRDVALRGLDVAERGLEATLPPSSKRGK